MTTFRVRKETNCKKLAGAIAAVIPNEEELEVHVIGKDAVNQAIKGIAIARTYIAPLGFDLDSKPSFKTIYVDGEERSGIKIVVRRTSL